MTGPAWDSCQKREPTLDIINDILLYLHNCHQKGLTQQQMESDTETHSQMVSGAWEILCKGKGELKDPEESRTQ